MASPVALMTVLFTDLVGSTELRARLGEEAAEDLRREYFALLRDALVAGDGEEVKTLGDGIMAAFPNASAALMCAVAIQQAATRHNRRKPDQTLAVHVGVSAGEVTCEEGDYFGTPVVEASRLCAAARGGQILVSELTGRLAGGRSGLALESLGQLTLKGLTDPVTTFEVLWDSTAASAIPLPTHIEAQRRRAFVGRVEELQVVTETLKAASTGERQIVLVAGEPGIGKTRLVCEAALRAHATGAAVLYGRCGEELGLPYRPIVEALRHYVTVCAPGQLAAHAETHGGELARLVPALAQLVPGLPPPRSAEPDTERFLLFEAVAGLLSEAAQDGVVMLLLDDLHWADRATVALVDHLVRWAEPMGLVILGTYRDSDLTRTHPLTGALADWRRDQLARRLALRGLNDADAVDLVALAAGHDLDEAGVALAHAVRRETDGSPFFLVEILRHLAETGALRQEEGRWHYEGDPARLGIPESVREVVGRRVQRLSEGAIRALGHAAVIGRDFDAALLERVLQEPEDLVLEGVEEALAARLVNEVAGAPGRFSFAHSIVRQTLYEEFSSARRLQLHRRVAEALEDLYGAEAGSHLPEFAHHWLKAVPPASLGTGDRTKAVDYARRAAGRATEALAYDQAARHYEAALQVVSADDDLLRCELLVELGDVRWRSGDVSRSGEAFTDAAALARRLGRAELLARSALGHGAGLGGAGYADRADPVLLDVLDEALSALGPNDHPLRVRLLSRLAVELYFTGEADRRDAAGAEAVAMAQRLSDANAQLVSLYSRHISMLGPDGIEERKSAAAELAWLSETVGDREMAFRGQYMRLRNALELGEIAQADDALEQCAALAEDLRQPFYAWQTLVFRATGALAEGRLAEGVQLARQAFETGQRAAPHLAPTAFGAHMAVFSIFRADFVDLLPRVKEQAASLPGEPIWQGAVAFGCAESGLMEEARTAFEAVAAAGFDRMPRNGNWITAVHAFALTAGLLGDAERAGQLYALLLPYEGRSAVSATGGTLLASSAGPLGALAATMGRFDEAVRHFEDALRRGAATRSRSMMVVTARDYARALLKRRAPGDVERAREVIDEGLATARAAGMERRVGQLQGLRP